MIMALELPFLQRRHSTFTVDVRVDDAGADALQQELLTLARRHDAAANVVVKDACSELLWTELSFVAVDVETTGFNPHVDRVIEVAWVRFERGRETERFSSLVNVDVDVPDPVRALTGITPAMLKGMPRFHDVATGLVDALASVDFAVAYNASFDRAFLSAELASADMHLPDVPFVDPLSFVRDLHMSGSKRLVDVARRFGVSNTGAHRAENDARATGELLLKLAPRLGASTLADLLDKQERWSRLPSSSLAGSATSPPAALDDDEPKGIGARILSLFR